MGHQIANRAVVLGGSMAGLVAAKVLAESFAEVVVVDRDKLTEVSRPRRGVPQGRHAHGLVARGQQILEGYFPGLTDDLVRAGVQPGDFSGDIRWYFNGIQMKPARSGLLSVPGPRWVLEYHVRRRVQAIPNVRFLEEHDILGLTTTPDGTRVTGARVHRHGAGSGAPEVLAADLVLDATGRGSRTPVWLTELRFPKPQEQKVKVNLAYTTRHYRLDSDPFGSDILIAPAATPSHPRGAFFYKLPGYEGRIELSLTGILGDYPPTDPDGFLEFARSLPVPLIYESIKDAEPLDAPAQHRYPASVRRHYEWLARFPQSFLVMGDAVCSFNPVYAQGMTVAALQSLVLREHLQAGTLPDARAFFNDVAKQIDPPWELAAGSDLGYPGVEGKRTMQIKVANAYVARLQQAAAHDGALTTAFIRAAGLIDPPQALLRPGLAVRVLRHGWRQPPASQVAAPKPVTGWPPVDRTDRTDRAA